MIETYNKVYSATMKPVHLTVAVILAWKLGTKFSTVRRLCDTSFQSVNKWSPYSKVFGVEQHNHFHSKFVSSLYIDSMLM